MSLMKRILGSYAQVLPFASLLHDDKRRGAEASPDLAQLPGVRLVTAAEPIISLSHLPNPITGNTLNTINFHFWQNTCVHDYISRHF